MDIDLQTILSNLGQMGLAYVLALPIGWDRERRSRGAGIRTFPLVSMAACAYMLTGLTYLDTTEAHARVMYGIITGIGFIGGGAILKDGGTVTGTASAASIWNTGAIGISVAMHQYEIALLLSVMNFVTLRFVSQLKRKEAEEKQGDRIDSP